jgi:hypothetical protein
MHKLLAAAAARVGMHCTALLANAPQLARNFETALQPPAIEI